MFNELTLVGRLTADPETRFTQNGKQVTKFTLATSEKWDETEKTEFHRIVTWTKLAEISEKYLKKGSLVLIKGKIEYSTSGEGESKKYYTDIIAREMRMLGGKKDPSEDYHEPSLEDAVKASHDTPSTDFEEDDLPF